MISRIPLNKFNHLNLSNYYHFHKDTTRNNFFQIICTIEPFIQIHKIYIQKAPSGRWGERMEIITTYSFSTKSLKTLSTPSVRNIIR